MRLLFALFVFLFASDLWAAQPFGIRLDVNSVSQIYPVVDSREWILTQPDPGKVHVYPDANRITHWGDEYYAQDWARGCGQTYGMGLYAGISGQIVWAGARGPYGNTVAIYDKQSGFVLKYSHLSEVNVAMGDYVLAGKSFVGRVGNTGNIQSSGCQNQPGSHLHLALFKNVVNPNARPVATTMASVGAGPTGYSVPFAYSTAVDLRKSDSNPTVYAMYYGTRVPISAGSFESHGWGFDKYQSVFNPLAGRVVAQASLTSVQEAYYFWPYRDRSLIRVNLTDTVYQFEDGRKHALIYNVFSCRNLRFGEVKEIPVGERDQYPPLNDLPAYGCQSVLVRTLAAWKKIAAQKGFSGPDYASYFYFQDWHPDWELRAMNFTNSGGQGLTLYISRAATNPDEAYFGYHDPVSGAWIEWQRIE